MTIGRLGKFSKNFRNTFIHKIFKSPFLAFLEIKYNKKENVYNSSIFGLG